MCRNSVLRSVDLKYNCIYVLNTWKIVMITNEYDIWSMYQNHGTVMWIIVK